MTTFSQEKYTALSRAAWSFNAPDVDRLLADPEVDLNYVDQYGFTLFFYACRNGQVDFVRRLLRCNRPINYNHCLPEGWAVVHTAAVHGYNSEVLRLLADDPRIDINALDTAGQSPLHLVNSVQSAKILLACDRYTQLDGQDEQGRTPLQCTHNNDVRHLIAEYLRDPVATRKLLRAELGGYPEDTAASAAELFAAIIMLADNYLALNQNTHENTQGIPM